MDDWIRTMLILIFYLAEYITSKGGFSIVSYKISMVILKFYFDFNFKFSSSHTHTQFIHRCIHPRLVISIFPHHIYTMIPLTNFRYLSNIIYMLNITTRKFSFSIGKNHRFCSRTILDDENNTTNWLWFSSKLTSNWLNFIIIPTDLCNISQSTSIETWILL